MFEAPNANDRIQSSSGLPKFQSLAFKAGKTPKAYSDVSNEKEQSLLSSGNLGFTVWDSEDKVVKPMPIGTSFILLGHYWKLNTFTGKDPNAVKYSSNMITDIKNHKLTVYANGNRTDHQGFYSDLKAKNIWTAETKIALFYLVKEWETGQLYSIELSNTVKNGIKRATLKAYGSPITAANLEKENVFSFAGKDDVFHVFQYNGLIRVNEKGMPYKGEPDMYFAPDLNCGVIRKENMAEKVSEAVESRNAFFDVLDSRQNQSTTEVATAAPTTTSESSHVEKDPFDDIDF